MMSNPDEAVPGTPPCFSLRGVTLAYGTKTIQQNLSFDVKRGSIFAIMGTSGCGKSTVLKSMIGLLRPVAGTLLFESHDYWGTSEAKRNEIDRRFGVLFQSSALWSAMTVGENVSFPLQAFTQLAPAAVLRLVELKLALVDVADTIDMKPAELSGGMAKRAALARALALDPDILFLDEPSAGLDPITSCRLDELIRDLRDGLGATIVIVSHELPSLFAIADDGIYLDAVTHTAIAHGSPEFMRDQCMHPQVQAFMHRARPAVQDNSENRAT